MPEFDRVLHAGPKKISQDLGPFLIHRTSSLQATLVVSLSQSNQQAESSSSITASHQVISPFLPLKKILHLSTAPSSLQLLLFSSEHEQQKWQPTMAVVIHKYEAGWFRFNFHCKADAWLRGNVGVSFGRANKT